MSHLALHIQICTVPTEPRGMVRDSPISDTPILERTLLAPKKRRREMRLSFGECGVHLPPQVEHTSRFIPGAAHLLSSRSARFEMRLVYTHLEFQGRLWRLKNASAAGVEVLGLGGVEALPPKHDCSPHVQRCTTPIDPSGMVPNTPIPEAPPVLRTLLAPQKRRRYSRWRFAARGV